MEARFPALERATLGIVAGNVAARVPGGVASNLSNTRVYRELAQRAGHTVLGSVLLPQRTPAMNDVLQWPDQDLIVLPPMASTIAAQRHTRAAFAAVREVAARSDVLFVRMPFQIPWALLGLNTPMLLHFGSDVYEIVRASTDLQGPLRAAALTYARLGEVTFRKLIRSPLTRVATNGRALLHKYSGHDRGVSVVSSCLRADEMDPEPRMRALGDPPKILFVGYLRPEKGVGVLLDAFDRMRSRRPMTLTIVGGTDRDTEAGRRIQARLNSSPHAADIHALGHVGFGPTLFDLYRTHDVMVLPSLSEGTPRALIEARAFSCPVVASRVGGIPLSVTDGDDGLLCAPGVASEVADAVERTLDDSDLRQRLIERGWARARATSLESFVDRLALQLELALLSRDG